MFLPVMLRLLGLIWEWGAQEMGRPIVDPPPLSVRNFPLTHLWFLYYLLLMYAAALAGRQLVVKLLDRSERIRQFLDRALLTLLKKRVAPFAFGLPLAIVALAVPEWNPATGNSVSRQVARPPAHTDGGLRDRVRRRLAVSAEHVDADDDGGANDIVAVDYVGLFRDHCSLSVSPLGKGVPAQWLPVARFGAGLATALTLWYWNLFLVGFALKHLSTPSSLRRYWADSSYWLYIAHLPLVTALQVIAAAGCTGIGASSSR